MAQNSFQTFSKSIMDEVLSWDPSHATQLGWHKYDEQLPDWSPASCRHQAARLQEMISELKRQKDDSLTEDERVDRDLAVHFFKIRIFELEELRMNEKVSRATGEIGDLLFFLFARDCPSFEKRLQAIIARLEAAPRFLEESRKVVVTPFKVWNEIQLETGQRIPRFLDEIEIVCDAQTRDKGMTRRLKSAVNNAKEAINDHNFWMKKELIPNSLGRASIGPSLYRRYLEHKGYGVTPEETLRIAEMYLQDAQRKERAIAKRIVRSGNPQEAIRKIRSDHPKTFEEVLKEYRRSVLQARAFVEAKRLVSLPEGEKLLVLETPVFMRHLVPYAAQYEPGKFDDDRTGMFLVTPIEGEPTLLEEHSYVGVVNTSVHEAYPGHHLHGICMNLNPSYIRPLCQSSDFAEGWGLYCEEMMISQGYNDNPTGRLTVLNDLIFRLARQICDVKLSMNTMSRDQAAKLISDTTGTDMRAAMSETKAMMLNPTYFMSYFVGKLGVLQIRDDLQRIMGNKFDLRFFHDSMIYSGSMPIQFVRRAVGKSLEERFGLRLEESKETIYQYALRNLGRVGA